MNASQASVEMYLLNGHEKNLVAGSLLWMLFKLYLKSQFQNCYILHKHPFWDSGLLAGFYNHYVHYAASDISALLCVVNCGVPFS